MQACSGQQQEDEQLEVSQQGEQGNQEEEGGQGDQEAQDQQGNESANQQGEQGEQNEYAEQQDEEEVAQEGEETENDLQEIIEQMNGQEGEQIADEGEALQQEGMEADAPMAQEVATEEAPAASNTPFQPGGTPAGPALPEMGSKMPYIVQKGDTMAKISGRIYGDTSHWQEMSSLSGLANPSRIYPGDLVYYTLDDQSLAFASAYESVAKSEEQVQAGDTLASIAQRVYGSSSAWKSIWRQNDGINNPDVIPPGSSVYYISQSALSAEISKTRVQLAKLAKIKAQNQRANGIVLLEKNVIKATSQPIDSTDA
jgi:nucleoid-associated protein YgaU